MPATGLRPSARHVEKLARDKKLAVQSPLGMERVAVACRLRSASRAVGVWDIETKANRVPFLEWSEHIDLLEKSMSPSQRRRQT